MRRRESTQRGWIFAAVALLHAGLIEIWVSDRPRNGSADPGRRSTELRWILVAPSNPPGKSDVVAARRRAATIDSMPGLPVGSLPQLPALAPTDDPATDRRPPVDWAAELERGVRAAVAAPAPPPRDFGFPHVPATAAPERREFGWYHARTHRVESWSEGGLLVNLNDRCLIVFAPLPLPMCRWGTIPVDGTLFDHMRDLRSPEAVAPPP